MEFGRQITVMRAVRGMHQKELARLSGIPNYTLSLIETGKMLPTAGTEAKIKRALRWPARAAEAFAILEGEGEAA